MNRIEKLKKKFPVGSIVNIPLQYKNEAWYTDKCFEVIGYNKNSGTIKTSYNYKYFGEDGNTFDTTTIERNIIEERNRKIDGLLERNRR